MINKIMKKYKVILGSKSPRRIMLLKEMGFQFKTVVHKFNEENFVEKNISKIAIQLAKKKSDSLKNIIKKNDLLITADTIVEINNKVIHKPKNYADAISNLETLSGKTHYVRTGVCLRSNDKDLVFSDKTKITFNKLNREDIIFYVKNYNPYDKAGGYGIQDWIGLIGIKKIEGDFNNVVGLPTSMLHKKLSLFV